VAVEPSAPTTGEPPSEHAATSGEGARVQQGPRRPRPLIMIGGTVPGAGKTTLMNALASVITSARGTRACMTLTEDEVWGERQLGLAPVDLRSARPEFAALLNSATPHEERAARLVDAFRRAATRANALSATWLQDWVWSDLAHACLGDKASPTATDVTAHLVHLATDHGFHPTVLFLRVDAQVALRRALTERGPTWFNRHHGADVRAVIDSAGLMDLADAYARAVPARREQLEAVGWDVVGVNADEPLAQVTASALSALGLDRATAERSDEG
jgi:thymidylate kinase